VDLIVTPEEVIHCARTPQGRPQGIIWSHLKEENHCSSSGSNLGGAAAELTSPRTS
jgi:hypothetical protein